MLVDSFGAGRLGDPGARGLDVRLGAGPGARSAISARGVLQAADREGRRGGGARRRLRRARRGLSCASRWSRTSTASARPRATSSASLPSADKTLHNVVALGAAADGTTSRSGTVRCRNRCGSGSPALARSAHRSSRLSGGQPRCARLAVRPARSASSAVSARAQRQRERGLDMDRNRLVRRPGRAGALRRHRRLRRADRRRGRGRARQRSRRRSKPASTSSPPTRRCSPSTAWRLPSSPRRTASPLNFEAAVAGGIPVIKTLREALAGNRCRASTAS